MCLSTLQKKFVLNQSKIKEVRGAITILNQYDEQGIKENWSKWLAEHHSRTRGFQKAQMGSNER